MAVSQACIGACARHGGGHPETKGLSSWSKSPRAAALAPRALDMRRSSRNEGVKLVEHRPAGQLQRARRIHQASSAPRPLLGAEAGSLIGGGGLREPELDAAASTELDAAALAPVPLFALAIQHAPGRPSSPCPQAPSSALALRGALNPSPYLSSRTLLASSTIGRQRQNVPTNQGERAQRPRAKARVHSLLLHIYALHEGGRRAAAPRDRLATTKTTNTTVSLPSPRYSQNERTNTPVY